MELIPTWTKAGSWTLGRDPLGLQATSVRLYRSLVPGLTNVTNRLRYYSYYCWVIQHYEKTEHSGDEAKWLIFIRRAEALYALACNVDDPQQSDGLAGGDWARAFRQNLPSGEIDLRPHTDKPGERNANQYLLAKRGNFGQFYIASMTEIGLLSPSASVPIVSEILGRKMANAFADSVGKTTALLSSAIRTGTLTIKELREIGKAAHPSRIPTESEEMKLLRDYLLARNEPLGNGAARRSSAWLLLDLLRNGVPVDDENAIRRAFYNRVLPDGSPHPRSGQTIDRWRAFQANELCHIALETLLNGLLSQLQKHLHGREPLLLISGLIEPVLSEIGAEDQSWQEWATTVGVEHIEAEEGLAEPVLSALGNVALAETPGAISSALKLLAVLWSRWSSGDAGVRETIERYAGRSGRSLAGVLRTLDSNSSKEVGQALAQAIRRHVISDHLVIAGRKLAATGTFTYHFTLSDGVVSDGRLTVYAYTNPRLRNLMRFLRDANLYDGTAVTQAGTRFLNESQPV